MTRHGGFSDEVWASQVTSLTCTLNHATTQSATAVEFQVAFTLNGKTCTTLRVAALRN